MATWQVIAGGTTYNLNDRNPFDVVSVTGVGVAPARRLTQRGPLQHGETDLGYRLDPRVINLVIAYQAASLSAADTHRDTLASIFRASDSPVYLRCTRDDSSVRQIDCFAIGLTDWPISDDDRVGVFQRVGVQLFCPDPLWYDPTATIEVLEQLTGDWYLAGGLITAGQVIAQGTNIATPTTWNTGGSVAAWSPWSVVVRTKRDDTGTDFNYMWASQEGSGAPGPSFGAYDPVANTVVSNVNEGYNADRAYGLTDDNYHFFMWRSTGGTNNFWIDGDDYYIPFGNVGLQATSRYWGADDTGANGYAQTLTHVAAYNIALTAAQWAAIRASIDGSESGTVTNAGNADAFPTITLTGPMTNPVLTNSATGEVLSFTITLADATETLTIDTRYGYKTVTDQEGGNQIAALSNTSDLATWHLAPGGNLISIDVDDVVYTGAVSLTWNNRYVGL